MSAVLNFDASQVAPDTGSQDAIPAGWYDVLMEASEMKPTKDTTGAYLECKFNIIAPQAFSGKKVYARLNLRNANPTAQEIGYKQLSAICHATRVLQVSDSAQLHNIPLKIKVKLRKADAEYEASNEITAYKNINEVVTMPGAPVATGSFPIPGAVAPAPLVIPAQAPAFAPPPQQQQAPMYAPPPAAPVYAPAPVQPPQQQQAPQWQQPAAQQPWQQPQAPQQDPNLIPQQQPQAPVYQQPQAPQQPVYQQPVQQQAPVHQPAAQQPNPAAAAQTATPPWMQPPPAAV